MIIDISNITSNNIKEFKYTEKEAFILTESLTREKQELLIISKKANKEDKNNLIKFIKVFDRLLEKVKIGDNKFTFIEFDYMLSSLNSYITEGFANDISSFATVMNVHSRMREVYDSYAFSK